MTNETDHPESLGAYRVESLLGRGGMGEVFLAWDARLERHVAIKRILPEPLPDKRARARFLREARAIARLNHPAILQVFDLFDADGVDCLVMEYVEGHGLSELLARGPLPIQRVLTLGREIATGLAEAHAKGLIHRDLKPDNVRIDTGGHAKILDFGLARLLFTDGAGQATMTHSGTLVGTVFAMSPEQASGREVDHRSDLFAFGALLYAMVTGVSPFLGGNVLDTLRRVTSESPEPVAALRPETPPALVELIDELLAKEPNRRPQNAKLVITTLERIAEPNGAGTESSAPPPVAATTATVTAVEDQITGEMPAPSSGARIETAPRLVVASELVEQARLIEHLGESRGGDLLERHDELWRRLLERHGGRSAGRGIGVFARAMDGVAFTLAYHRGVENVTEPDGELDLAARSALHFGEVMLRHRSGEEVASGALVIEAEGQARMVVERLLGVAHRRQILLSRSAFDLARGAAASNNHPETLRWLAHGSYVVDGLDDSLELFEVGLEGFSPLSEPVDSPLARRAVSFSDELVLGWRPARGQAIPRRPTWTLTEPLGEGGYGEVWLATHASAERRVFKFCFEASRLRALQREVTLLRLLRDALGHRTDITRVLDWNLDAAPYFVELEHASGGDVVSWAGDSLASIPLATRIELVAQVADALEAAHSVGVLHKDVKPENVLIETVDDRPTAKLTDFGIGLLLDPGALRGHGLDPRGFTDTLDTATTTGSRVYVAPELLEGKPATVQADLYSLGVVLYQITVADLDRPLATGWRRDVEDPLLAEDIARLTDGSPEHRPAGAGEVARSLRRLEARHVEVDAQTRRVRRRRLGRGFLAVAALLVAVLGMLWLQAESNRRQAEALAERADRARGEAEELIAFMLGDLHKQLRAVGRLDALESAGHQALDYFDGLDAADRSPATLARWAKALHQMGDIRMAEGDLDGAEALFSDALARTREQFAAQPSDDALFELGQSLFWVGNVHWRRGDYAAATPFMEGYLARSAELSDRDPKNTDWLLEVAFGHNNVADLLLARNNPALALEHFRHALDISQRLVTLEPERGDRRLRVATAHLKIAEVDYALGDIQAAASQAETAVELLETLVREQPDQSPWLRRLALALDWAATYRLDLGALDTAHTHWQRNLEIVESLHRLDPSHLEWRTLLVASYRRRAEMLDYLGDPAEARQAFDRALDIAGPMAPGDDFACRTRATTHSRFARHHLARGRAGEASRQAEAALELLAGRFQPDDLRAVRFFAQAHLVHGEALAASGDDDRAEAAWVKARRLLTEQLAATKGRSTPRDLIFLAQVNQLLGRREEAETHTFALLGMGARHPRLLACCASFIDPS
ncbi:MAG: protein kinase [Acidobacteriota bacterium]